MKATTFSERLNVCLDKEGFPLKNRGRITLLAEMVGLTHRGASKWVNGQSAPPASKYALLAKQLNVNETWLRTGIGSMFENDRSLFLSGDMGIVQEVAIYPVHQLKSSKRVSQKSMTCILPYRSVFFGIRLETEAMSPRFPNGSIIIFDANASPKDGDFVLAHFSGYPEPIFRQLLMCGDFMYLDAHNPKFDRITLVQDSDMMGKLVQAIVSFE